jgi:sulfite exporter TauE/SafE
VPIDLLPLSAALLAGLMGSVHCMAMCGGIATGLMAAGETRRSAGVALGHAFELNLGRVAGYAVAGAAVGAFGGGLLRIADSAALQTGVRVALGVAMMLLALRLVGAGDRWNLPARLAAPAWRALAPLRARVLPAGTRTRRIALGLLWGWLPCGLSSSLLAVAWLQAEALDGALVMAAFGLGTLPAMVPLAWSGTRSGAMNLARSRRAAAVFVFLAGLLTASAPWLMQVPVLHDALTALGCRPAA